MKNAKMVFNFILLVLVLESCGPKEKEKVCASGVRKEFIDDNIKATVEEGCITKFEDLNHYQMDGSLDVTVMGDTMAKKVIALSKGELVSTKGRFIIKSDKSVLKIRLAEGAGHINYNGKKTDLLKDNLLTIGK
jgi:hypothetical protein